MRKTVLTALIVGAAVSSVAQEAAPSKAEARIPRVAVIDLEQVWSDSLLGKGYRSQMDALAAEIRSAETKKQAEAQKLEGALKTLQEDFEKQQGLISGDAQERKRGDIVKRQRELQAFLEDAKAELEGMRQRAQKQAADWQDEFQKKIQGPIEAVAKEKAIDIIVARQAAMIISKEFEISQEVVVKADDAERSAKAKAGAAKPAAAPTPAAPKPSPSPQSR